jgi:hypothetical protein
MRVLLFAVAESAAIDQGTNRLSLFNLLEEIISPAFTIVFPQLTIATISSREEVEPSLFTLSLRITLGDQQLVESSLSVDFQGRPRARTLGVMSGLMVPRPGNLRLALSEAENELSAWDVMVRHIGEPTIVTQPTGPSGSASTGT